MLKYNLLILASITVKSCYGVQNDTKKTDNPNIIFILADDLGYGDVSCLNGYSKIKTHNIDKLASQGIQFTDAHTSSAVCTPTRYGILTGRYNWRTILKNGVLSGYSKALIDPDRLTVGELLQQNNYKTGFVGKWHLGWDWAVVSPKDWKSGPLGSVPDPKVDFSKPILNGPKEHGFDYSYGIAGSLDMPPFVYVENGEATSVPVDSTVNYDDKGYWRKGLTGSDFVHVDVLPNLTAKAIHYIREQASAHQPFFLYFALPAPHTPILPTPEFMGRSNTNFYGDFVMQVDDVIGKIMAEVEKTGIEGHTILIFTSDNGCSPKANFEELKKAGHNPSYIFRGMKADIYEGGHRVPFIVRWPGIVKPASKSAETICTTDLMATIADMLDYSLPDNTAEDSFSFLPALSGNEYKSPIREAIVHHSLNGRFALRKGDWKLILWPGSGGYNDKNLKGLPLFQLYNLKDDPGEEKNLIDVYPAKAFELKELLTTYIERGRSTPGKPQRNEGMDNWPEIEWMHINSIN